MTLAVHRATGVLLALLGSAALVLGLLSGLDGDWLPLVVLLPGIVAYLWSMLKGTS